MATSKPSPSLTRPLDLLLSSPISSTLLGLTLLSTTLILYDFHAWTSFGTGGTPPTWAGYYRMTKLRLNALLHPDDLTDPSPLSQDGPKFLKSPLPQREGKRPAKMPRIMPQRQVPGPISPPAKAAVQSLIHRLGAAHPDLLIVKPSKTEGGSTEAIYARPELESLNPIARDKILDHEIAHAHPADNSLHVWLSDGDAREVVGRGWGERFPLKFVKSGWTMVYAPRDGAEVEVVEGIVRAGVEWITGREI